MSISTKPKVLICDDDRTHLMILEQTLSSEGYQIEQAINGEEALAACDRVNPDIVLLDVNMPGMNGYAVCRQIRARDISKHIPILMITGSDDQQSIEQAFEAGATDFLPKPIKWPLVRHRIKYMLRSHDYQKSLQSREDELRNLAYFDALTKLPNRLYFTELLDTAIIRASRQKSALAVMFINLDSFKRINDTLGHNFGDSILTTVANRISADLRDGDTLARSPDEFGVLQKHAQIARLGGDEFIILLNDCGSNDIVMNIAQRLITKISRPIIVDQYNLVVTASIGVSIYPIDGCKAQDLIKFADIAMHEAKEDGKACIRLHSKAFNERSMNRLKLEEYMREALTKGMFELFYQAQLNAKSGQLSGAEALLRLHHPELGIIPPNEFVPIAEDTGLIIEIGYWVIKQACNQLVKWRGSALDGKKLSVNVSVKQINQPNFVDQLADIIAATGADPRLLEIELTESIIMKNQHENIAKLNAIKRLGVRLSIDDFGTGYSSLSYLKRFPLHTLKIDRSFVIGMIDDINSEGAAIVKAIAAMADALSLNVIVEGVETAIQLSCIQGLCSNKNTVIQGYYFAKPLPLVAFEKYAKDLSQEYAEKDISPKRA